MKSIIIVLVVLFSGTCFAQMPFIAQYNNSFLGYTQFSIVNTGPGPINQRRMAMDFPDSAWTIALHGRKILFDSLPAYRINTANWSVLTLDSMGYVKSAKIDWYTQHVVDSLVSGNSIAIAIKQNNSDTLSWDATKSYVNNRGFLLKSDSNIYVNKYQFDTSKAAINTAISTKLNSRYIPINIDSSNINELQSATKLNNIVTLSQGGGSFSVADQDSLPTNELQNLTIASRVITLSQSGGSVTIPIPVYDSIPGKPIIPPGQVNTDWNAVSGVAQIFNKPVVPSTTTQISEGSNLYFTNARAQSAISLTTTGNTGPATYNSGVFNIPTPVTTVVPTFNSTPGRLLSTTGSDNTFTISGTKNARVHYTVNFSVTLLLALSNGVVSLDYSMNSGSTWTTVSRVSQVFGVSITITTSGDQTIGGEIPANALVRVYRSTASNVTVTLPTNGQQEVQY